MAKVVMPGGTGHLGRLLTRHFVTRGDEVVVLPSAPLRDGVRVTSRKT